MQVLWVPPLALVLLLGGCAAPPRIEAADPGAPAPPVVYRSALGAAVAEGSEAAIPWPAANEAMRQAGGHMGHLAPGAEPAVGPPAHKQ